MVRMAVVMMGLDVRRGEWELLHKYQYKPSAMMSSRFSYIFESIQKVAYGYGVHDRCSTNPSDVMTSICNWYS